jgi:hypothetical protein
MTEKRPTLFEEPLVVKAFKQAWLDSQPGPLGGHEEGGFVLRDMAGNLSVRRWPQGEQNIIIVPPHPDCKIDDCEIVATFHTHPNTGSDFLQEPSETDRRAVRDDPSLKGMEYEGEYVISQNLIYLIAPTGQVNVVGDSQILLTHRVMEA